MANKISNNTAAFILHDLYCAKIYDDPIKKTMKLLKEAAKLISNDLKTAYTNKTFFVYPNTDVFQSFGMNTQFMPRGIVQFLQDLFSAKDCNIQVCSIGQAIMQAARQRSVLCTLHLGLAVQLLYRYASKYLLVIDILNSVCFCFSYSEV